MKRLIFLGSLLCLTAGCSHLTVLRTQELKQVEAHTDSLSASMKATQDQLIAMQKEHQELLRLIRADQQVRFGELDQKTSALEGNISESQQRLTQIDQKTQQIKQSWDEKARADSMAQIQKVAEMDKLLQLAKDDFMAHRYDLALNGFQDIRTRFPATQQCEDASFMIAECFAAQQKVEEAENGYKSYIKEYPQGRNICPCLYKLGGLYDKMKKERSKEAVWKKLLESCPSSEEATAVKQQMK